jgi:hypothetical protein
MLISCTENESTGTKKQNKEADIKPTIKTHVEVNNPSFENQQALQDSLHIFDNFGLGLLKAQETGKPIFLYFTGYSVVNARKVEDQLLFKNKIVYQKMKEDYIHVWLYCDDKVVGKKNMKLHYNMTQSTTLPSIVLVSSEGTPTQMLLEYDMILTELEKSL